MLATPALLEHAVLSGGLLLAALVLTFVGGVLITYAIMRHDARALYRLLRPKTQEAPDDADGRSTRLR
jgi:hypothetical protein